MKTHEKTHEFQRIIEKKDGTRRKVTTRIKAESRDQAFDIFDQKFGSENLAI